MCFIVSMAFFGFSSKQLLPLKMLCTKKKTRLYDILTKLLSCPYITHLFYILYTFTFTLLVFKLKHYSMLVLWLLLSLYCDVSLCNYFHETFYRKKTTFTDLLSQLMLEN